VAFLNLKSVFLSLKINFEIISGKKIFFTIKIAHQEIVNVIFKGYYLVVFLGVFLNL
jgi:hypothetical protein